METESRFPSVADARREEACVDTRRYHSEERRERLAAMAPILDIVSSSRVTERVAFTESLTGWRVLLVAWATPCGLVFRSGIDCTAIEQVGDLERRRSGPQQQRSPEPWQTPTRSPPGDSSR